MSCFWLDNDTRSHRGRRARWCNAGDRKRGVAPSYSQPGLNFLRSGFTPGERKPPRLLAGASLQQDRGGCGWGCGTMSGASRAGSWLRTDGVCRKGLQMCGRGLREGVDRGEGVVSLLPALCLTLG